MSDKTANAIEHLAEYVEHNLSSEMASGPWGRLTLADTVHEVAEAGHAVAKAIDRLARAVEARGQEDVTMNNYVTGTVGEDFAKAVALARLQGEQEERRRRRRAEAAAVAAGNFDDELPF